MEKEIYKGIWIKKWFLHYSWLDENSEVNRIVGIQISTEGKGKYSIHGPFEHVEYVDDKQRFEIPLWWNPKRWECINIEAYNHIFTVFLRDKKLDEDLE